MVRHAHSRREYAEEKFAPACKGLSSFVPVLVTTAESSTNWAPRAIQARRRDTKHTPRPDVCLLGVSHSPFDCGTIVSRCSRAPPQVVHLVRRASVPARATNPAVARSST